MHCPICRTFLAEIVEQVDAAKAQGIEVVAVAMDGSERLQKTIDEKDLAFAARAPDVRGMSKPPPHTAPYRRTDTFTVDTVPAGLLRDHKTRAGTWGVIHVLSGAVTYRIPASGSETTLIPGTTGLIEPEVLHSVALSDDATFYVEFWR